MKIWNVMRRSLSIILLTMLTLVVISSYGAGNVVASYSAGTTGGDSVTVAKFSAEINKVEKSDVVMLTDENAPDGVCFPFTVTVDTEASCVLDVIVDFEGQTTGFDLYLMRCADDKSPMPADQINEARDHWEFNGSKHVDRPEFVYNPSSEPVTRTYYLLFKEAYHDSINRYQLQNNINISARIVQID